MAIGICSEQLMKEIRLILLEEEFVSSDESKLKPDFGAFYLSELLCIERNNIF